MNRKFAMFAPALALGLSLAACSDDEAQPTDETVIVTDDGTPAADATVVTTEENEDA